MDNGLEKILEFIEEEDAKFIRLAFRDAYGIQKNISVMPSEIAKACKFGIPINAREITGFRDSEESSLYLKPDPTTMAVLPWRPDSGRVIRLFCDVYTASGENFSQDSRYILKDAMEKAKKAGINFKFGSEAEFYLFKKDDEGNVTDEPYDNGGYMDIAPLDKGENIRREICLTIEKMGLTPERSHHERGPGQNEIDFHYGNPLKAADQMTTFKMVVNTVADRNGLVADFSPKPIKDKPGNGYHINLYVNDDNGEDLAKYAAAGIMEKIREMTVFMNPASDSYSRFGSGTAPDRVNWSETGDTELIHIDNYMGKTRVELRSPDALSNPYLVYSLLIHAGLYGIENKIELPAVNDEKGQFLPQSKKEAAQIAGESDFIKSILPEELIKIYTTV
ncbi:MULTISPECIES: glutamine synthetase family protein [Eubacterium]|uniref:glutamine synthetase family protein n=1 Tax=Eubacterium TaxID=1730 RepID=UPI00156850D0|nr:MULTISPECIES: glutamine synthetase family protein [Eubacterium]MCR5367952.1 glutamine synthetase family protein [Eubacterium sp.]